SARHQLPHARGVVPPAAGLGRVVGTFQHRQHGKFSGYPGILQLFVHVNDQRQRLFQKLLETGRRARVHGRVRTDQGRVGAVVHHVAGNDAGPGLVGRFRHGRRRNLRGRHHGNRGHHRRYRRWLGGWGGAGREHHRNRKRQAKADASGGARRAHARKWSLASLSAAKRSTRLREGAAPFGHGTRSSLIASTRRNG